MIVKCVVACMSTEGADFYPCRVVCNQADYDEGVHYEIAEDAAADASYERPMVTFDENDGPDWLFSHFAWDKAPLVHENEDEDDFDDFDDDEEDDEEDDA